MAKYMKTEQGYMDISILVPKPFKPSGKSYLTFRSLNSFTLAVYDKNKHWDGTIEYFASDKTWTVWDGTSALSAVADDGEYVLYMRGTGNTVITGYDMDYRWVLTGSDIACVGNIENLLDYATVESGAHPPMADFCYSYMFQGCTALTQAPALPATTLVIQCYYYMFKGCTSLTQAPALPATKLANQCYYCMFSDCKSLTQAPALPAKTLATYCYSNMFQGCTALTQAPALPATTLATYCYSNMFQGCTALTQAPALPATKLADQCYRYMFQGCTALTQAPALPATTLVIQCYSYMFQGCTALTQAPALPATKLANQCYSNMFQGCTSLKLSSTKTDEYTQEYRIPSSGDGVTASNSLLKMFASTGGTFTGTPAINTTYYLSSDNMIVRETEVATLNGYVGSMIDFAIGEYADSAEYIIPSSTEGSTKKFKLSVDDSGTIKTTNTDDSVEVQFARTSDIPTVDSTLTHSGQAADAAEVGKEIRTVSGKIPTVFDWAKKELFDKADLVDPAGINSFLTIDGVEYYRYHCGPNNFEWNNPKPYPGSVTITARAVSQYGGTNGTRLLTIYDDGTYGPTLFVIVGGESKTVTVTTDPDKTLAKITGNYDMENWALLDMSVMSCVANYNTGLPLANSNAPGGVIADPVTEEYTVPAKIGKDGKMYVPDIPVVDATLTQSGQAADAAKVGEELRSLSEEIKNVTNSGNGLTSSEKTLILSLFKKAAYTADMSSTITRLEKIWSDIGGSSGGVVVSGIEDVVVTGSTATDDGNGNVVITGLVATSDGNGNITVTAN